MTSRIPLFILMTGLFLVLSTSCRYKIEKYDDKITGLWYYRGDPSFSIFYKSSDHWLLFSEDGTSGSMAGPHNLDSMIAGPYPYELEDDILTRYYPTESRQYSIEIKRGLGGRKLTLSLIGANSVKTYTLLKKNP